MGVIGTGDLLVSQRAAGANMSVDVAAGEALIPDGSSPTYAYHGTSTATENVVITANASGNPRWDAIVGWVDATAYGASDNVGAFKFAAVAGTPGASPTVPTDADINSGIGTYRFHRIGEVYVPNGATQIVNANDATNGYIHDRRLIVQSEDNVDRDYKSLPERVHTGMQPATSANLTSDVSVGNCVVRGKRVRRDRTESHLYTASKDTYVDISSAGVYTFTAVANGAAEPAVASNSIRLAKVVTDADNITSVSDLRNLYADYRKTATGDLALAAAMADIPGTSVTFEVSQASILCAYAQAYSDASPAWSVNDVVNIKLNVDTADNAISPQVTMSTTGTANTLVGVWRVTLASGAHTIKLRAQNGSGTRGRILGSQTAWQYNIVPLSA